MNKITRYKTLKAKKERDGRREGRREGRKKREKGGGRKGKKGRKTLD